MRVLLILSALICTNVFAEEGYYYSSKFLKGSDVVSEFKASAATIDEEFSGDSSDCKTTFRESSKKGEAGVFTFSDGTKVYPFVIYKKAVYQYQKKESDESIDVRGWFTKDTIKIGPYKLVFSLQGDMGYTTYFYVGSKLLVECDTGF